MQKKGNKKCAKIGNNPKSNVLTCFHQLEKANPDEKSCIVAKKLTIMQ